ncbi:related to negative acting factor [Phialocephala subalpina]|uniref:Related to negative acting factor n=1 Tax=Phialocephala subalpina TaxID=576137 RepID=A0A1L7WF05_9HELO|nr:related to negative acting factor [Phialocephala subalpina]
MSRMSRGCLPCRTRKVKCDEGRPACQRCVQRGDICVGYRDDIDMIFRFEHGKPPQPARTAKPRRRLSYQSSRSRESVDSPSDLSIAEASSLRLPPVFPWAKRVPENMQPSAQDQAVDMFFEKFVMYPCNENSTPGFLEHLPSLFKDIKKEGRVALRWAVRAAAYASLSNEQKNASVYNKALQCYSLALSNLGESLKNPETKPDDYVLMTVVVLDLFECMYLHVPISEGQHSQGMAQILRLRGPDQIYSARGWSMFRLAHHRLQKEQLALGQAPIAESQAWMDSLNEEIPDVRLEKHAFEISKISERARRLLKEIETAPDQTLIKEMLKLDRVSTTWRNGPEWAFKTVPTPTGFIQLHRDVWIAYEWNYHRTARIILHKQLLDCLERMDSPELTAASTGVIRGLTDEILSTVPQMMGDIDSDGRPMNNQILSRGIGAYFLLWPIKVVKGASSATEEQRKAAQKVFERIRDYTGMKTALGEASSI